MPATLNQMPMTREIARAIATDAANRSMRAAGRSAWSREDLDCALATFFVLWPQSLEDGSETAQLLN